MKSRMRLLALIAALSLAVLALGGCDNSKPHYTAHDIRGIMPDLAFTLTGVNGKTSRAADFAGEVVILYFGYTNCPYICPATMARVRAALAGLSRAQRQRIRVLFVSVDPKRDTPKRLAKWTSGFGPRFTGLTGTQTQLKRITKRYHVTYSYGKPNARGWYKVSHSTGLYVFDPSGHIRLLAKTGEKIKQLTADLKTLLSQVGATSS